MTKKINLFMQCPEVNIREKIQQLHLPDSRSLSVKKMFGLMLDILILLFLIQIQAKENQNRIVYSDFLFREKK